MTDQSPSVADFSVAVNSGTTQGRHTPALTHKLLSEQLWLSVQRLIQINGWLKDRSALSLYAVTGGVSHPLPVAWNYSVAAQLSKHHSYRRAMS